MSKESKANTSSSATKPTAAEIIREFQELLKSLPLDAGTYEEYKVKEYNLHKVIEAYKPEDNHMTLPRLEVKPESMEEGELYLLEFKCGEIVVVKKETNDSEGTHLRITCGTWHPFYGQMNKALYGPIHLEKKEEE